MRIMLPAAMLSAVFAAATLAAESDKPVGQQIIDQYLKMPIPATDPKGEARIARLQLIKQISQLGDEAVDALAATFPRLSDPKRRAELAGALGAIPTRASADQLVKLLKDPDDQVRWNAIHYLRLLASRVDRSGGKRQQRGDEHPPKVGGLVPHLIAAASDKAPANRDCAAYALADTLDPAAIAQLRKMLKDDNLNVRLHAACFLTEFADASGLPELRRAIDRFRPVDGANLDLLLHAEMLLASLERITGKSFGPIPMDPGLMSNLDQAAAARQQYKFLLDAYAQWFAWNPPPASR